MFCDGAETCSHGGQCLGGPDPCAAGETCDEDGQTCICMGDADCDDGEPCTGTDSCVDGACVFNDDAPCTDEGQICNPFNPDVCGCTADIGCDNGIFCDGQETCFLDTGQCNDGTGDPCEGVPCNESAGVCGCQTDGDCDDEDVCNGVEACIISTGKCEAGIALDCTDGVSCTVNECDPETGCVNTPDDAVCDDGDVCTLDSCDAVEDCVNDAEAADGTTCDDGVVCTVEDACVSGMCAGLPDDGLCDNLFFCDGMEICDVLDACQDGLPACDERTTTCDENSQTCIPLGCVDELDCDDTDICTDDFCVEGMCENEFNSGNDPSCVGDKPELTVDASCAYGLGVSEVCFDFTRGPDDGEPGGADEITAIGYCVNWNTDDASFDCMDGGGTGVPDDITFFVDTNFTTLVTCNLEQPDCMLRLSILDTTLPFATLPSSTLACARFEVTNDDGDLDIPIELAGVSAGDVEGTSISVVTEEDSIDFSDCCVADCNNDDQVDIADAVAVILEFSDDDSSDVCDTQGDVPYDGVPCCDCNDDAIIDVADAVCVVNGIGGPFALACPPILPEPSSVPTADLRASADGTGQSSPDGGAGPVTSRQRARSRHAAPSRPGAPLSLEQQVLGDSVVVPLVFKQGRDDGRRGGVDELTAFSICIDFDQDQLEFDATDGDEDGVPDALGLLLPPSHSPIVRVDLTRSNCELQIGMIDLSAPSESLQDGEAGRDPVPADRQRERRHLGASGQDREPVLRRRARHQRAGTRPGQGSRAARVRA